MWIFAIVMADREINHKPWLKDKQHWVLLFPCILVSTDCLYFKSKKKDIHIACLGESIGALPGISDDSLVMGSRDYLSSPSVSDCPFLLSCCWALETVVFFSGCFHFMLDTIPLPSLFHCIIPWQSHLVILCWCFHQCREPRKKPNNHLPLFLKTSCPYLLTPGLSHAPCHSGCPSTTTIFAGPTFVFPLFHFSWSSPKNFTFPFGYVEYFKFYFFVLASLSKSHLVQ